MNEAHQTDEKFRLVVDASPNGMVVVDAHGKMVLVSPKFEDLFGYARAELIGRPIERLVPERFRAGHPTPRTGFVARPVWRSMGAGRCLHGLRKDRTEFPIEIALNPLPATRGGIYVPGSVIDITTHMQQREGELRRMSTAFQDAMDPVLIKDLDGHVVNMNKEAERAYGWTRAALLGEPVKNLAGC